MAYTTEEEGKRLEDTDYEKQTRLETEKATTSEAEVSAMLRGGDNGENGNENDGEGDDEINLSSCFGSCGVSIDTVYQRVLALANKEQRGYITPQEFNLFANQIQMDMLEQYFYDINQWGRQHGNDTEYSAI